MGLRMKANGAALLMGIFLMGMVFAEAKLCRTLPVGAVQGRPNVTIWGQETLIAFGSGFREIQGAKPGVEGPWMAPLITAGVISAISAYALYKAPEEGSATLMYYLLAMYPFGTAVVELARVNFDGSRFGFLTAAFHNLFEYGMILFLFADYKTAKKWWPLTLLWVWAIDMWIMFVPALPIPVGGHLMTGVFWAGLLEQLTGIVCDFLLINLFWYWFSKGLPLNITQHKNGSIPEAAKEAYFYGLLGAFMHMLEIGPLVVLLSGLAPRPSIPICILVAFTTPITMWFYSLKAAPKINLIIENKPAIPFHDAIRIFAISLALGWGLILLPSRLIPECP